MARILIVEDETRIADFLRKGLTTQGFTTETVHTGSDALLHAGAGGFDLVVLDLGLPDMDGMTVLATLRARGCDLPVIILTARDSVDATVAGLQGGADDYLGKPFAFDELLARIRLRLRPSTGTVERQVVSAGGAELDLLSRRVRVVGAAWQDLTSREFALAEQFFAHPDLVLTRQQLLSRVWDLDFDPGSNVVDVYVRYLRRKLGDDAIETVRGTGYRLRVR